MHRSIASAAAAVVLAAALTACGSSGGGSSDAGHPKMPGFGLQSGDQTPDDTAGDMPVADPTTTRPTAGKIGDTLTLEGSPGTTAGTVLVDITLNKYEDHAKATLGVFDPPTGQRLAAAQFTIAATGDAAYTDSTGYLGAKVVDDQGQTHPSKPGDSTSGSSFPLILSVQPGQKATGWVVFDVPQDAKITGVQYSMDPIADGFGDSKPEGHGRWSLN